MSEQSHARRSERQEEPVDEATVSEAGKAAVAGAQAAAENADDFLDKIDELLGTEEEAQEFVESYVQRGGQ